MEYKLSVIIPVYNVEAYLRKCLESVQNQTFRDFEVLIIDDESPDNSRLIAEEFAQLDTRFRVISQKNKGLGGARNTGILAAKGEFLFFLDSDDYIRSDTLEKLHKYATHNDLDIVVFDYDKVNEKKQSIASPRFGKGIVSKEDAFKEIISLRTSPMSCNKLYKKSLFLDSMILYPEKFLHEDLAITYKLFWNSDKIGFIGETFYYWLIREDSITQKFTYKHVNDITKTLMDIKQFLNSQGIYEQFEPEYIRGSVKMLNLILERSFSHSKYTRTMCLIEYVLYIIESKQIIDKVQIDSLQQVDEVLYNKFISNWNKCQKHLASNVSEMPIYSAVNMNEMEMNQKTIFDKFTNNYYKIGRKLFPPHSIQRKIIKKILRRR